MNAQNNAIKMIASFNRGIFIPLIGENQRPEGAYNTLKERGARISLEKVRNMMEGREEAVKDFEMLRVTGHRLSELPQTAPAVKRGPVPTGNQNANLLSHAENVPKGRGREYPPSGTVKALKRGTVYAALMEMLMQGATMKELLSATDNTTAGGVNDVLSWQIKNRGYGLRFEKESGKYFIVLPHGHKSLTYKD